MIHGSASIASSMDFLNGFDLHWATAHERFLMGGLKTSWRKENQADSDQKTCLNPKLSEVYPDFF